MNSQTLQVEIERLTRQAPRRFRANSAPCRISRFIPRGHVWAGSHLVLVISIQPDEGIVLGFQAKHPGAKMHLRTMDVRFNYQDTFSEHPPDA
jgi:glucose-6-phosphate 1-dehydrogenase